MSCDYFNVQDLFTAGLGFDIAGALLLARGVISSALDLTRLSGSFYGSNAYVAVAMARDRIDAISGLTALALGFLFQAVGYTASLATTDQGGYGTAQAATGGLLLLLAALLVLACGSLHRRLRLVPTLIEMSHYTLDGKRMEYPRQALLPRFGEALGRERIEGEDDLTFARRTLGVEDLTVDVTQTAEFSYPRTRRASEPPLEGEPPA